MGLRLKAQLMVLSTSLFLLAFGVLTYFNLTLAVEDNRIRNETAGRKLADLVMRQILIILKDETTGEPAIRRLAGQQGNSLITNLRPVPELRHLDIYSSEGQRLLGFGRSTQEFVRHREALAHVRARHEPFSLLWAYSGEEDQLGVPWDAVGVLFHGWVAQEHYQPILDSSGNLVAIAHLSLEIPRAPLRVNLVILGNLLLGAIFLFSTALALYLWAEFALNRPLKNLVESHQRLREVDVSPDDEAGLISANELATVSRSFNRLTLDLVKYQRELEEKTRRLEQANQNYRVLNEQLEQKVEEKTREMKEFFSLVTHDLRIPLAAVSGYAELLHKPKTGELSDKQKRFVDQILVANHHAQELVRNLLDAMKYEFGTQEPICEEFDLIELVSEVVAQVSVGDKPLHLNLPEVARVFADRGKIARVLGNLLSNAMRHGQVTLSITPAKERWQIEVTNDGPAIPAEHLPLLFDKFKQFPGVGGPSSGLGLGLYIVRRILEDHQQTIVVSSTAEEGTTFRFWLAAKP